MAGSPRYGAGVPRLFLTIWPPDEAADELLALHRKDQQGVRFVPPDNWHVTLRFFGEAHPGDVAGALDRLVLPACRARLGPAVDVMNERALVVPVTGVDELAGVVREHTAHIGEPPQKRFVGHLTVARVKAHAPMPRALGALVSAEFDVHEIALVQSRLEPEGARYETIATWPVG